MLLDSDILIDLLRGKKEARDFLRSLPEHSPPCCSAITVAEIHSGMRESERQLTTELIDSLLVLPVTREVAELAGRFKREHHGGPGESQVELDDCLIAATAVAEGLEIATRNKRHYPMPEVKLVPAGY